MSVTLEDRDAEPHVGQSWRDNTMAGLRPRMRTTELTPFRLWAEEGTWGGITAVLRLRFTAITSGTRIDATGSLSGNGAWSVPVRVAGRLAGPAIRHDLARAGEVLDRTDR